MVPEELLSAVVARIVEELEELCALSTPSGDAPALGAAMRHLAGLVEARGLQATVRDERGEDGIPWPLLVATAGAPDALPVVLVGHLDTVLPAIPPRREGARLWASGALDMKGGLLAFLGALDLRAALGRSLPDLRLLVVPDEESSGALSARAMARHVLPGRALLVLEPGSCRAPVAGRPVETVVLGRRGLVEFSFEVRGRAAHSGLDFARGRSAVVAAADFVSRAAALSRSGGATVNLARLVGGDARFVESLATEHPLLGTSVRRNVVPDLARVDAEARFLSRGEGDRVREALAQISDAVAADHGVTATLRFSQALPPVDPEGPGAAWARHAAALADARGWTLEIERDRGGVSFPNLLPEPGVLPVLDGLGPVGEGMHTRDEWLDLDSLARRMVLLADLLDGPPRGGAAPDPHP